MSIPQHNYQEDGTIAFERGIRFEDNPYRLNPGLSLWGVGWKLAESRLVEQRLQETLAREGLRAGEEQHSVHLALEEVRQEIYKAKKNWPDPAHSAHEQYAVLLEEVDELWDHVKVNQKKRDLVAMRKEAMQVAAMAVRFMTEVCDEVTGRR